MSPPPICPACRKQFTEPESPEDLELIKAGDPTICGGCAALLIFEADGGDRVRLPTIEEIMCLGRVTRKNYAELQSQVRRDLARKGEGNN